MSLFLPLPLSLLARSPSPRSLGPSGELLARHSWTCQALASFQTIAMVVTCSTLCQRGSGQTLRAADIGVTHLPLRCKMQVRATSPLCTRQLQCRPFAELSYAFMRTLKSMPLRQSAHHRRLSVRPLVLVCSTPPGRSSSVCPRPRYCPLVTEGRPGMRPGARGRQRLKFL